MKKVKLLLTLPAVAMLSSCNMRLLGDYSFNHIHIQVNAGEPIYHYEIKSWTNSDDDGIEIQLKDGTSMFVNGGYILYDSEKCPICEK